ncbi:hypothetical protein [Psychromonas ossibalaenae]|uniref:hypothetical protein n=1 Tax=Psychromonas ossibalaenae TaxID=444922 RepID=UPI00037DEE0E|nr:hypothetical protein [Psychromonas ossibalaenae]
MTAVITSQTPQPLSNSIGYTSSTEAASAGKEVKAADNTAPISKTTDGTAGETVSFTSRAIKIQSIASDFFGSGQLSMADIPKYIQRLQSDGLLTHQQVEQLGYSKTAQADKNANAVVKVLDFIESFTDKVSSQDPEDNLIGTLDRAKKVIENLDSTTGKLNASDVKVSLIEITAYLNGDQAEKWDEQDLNSLKEIKNIISATNQIHFSQTNSTAANRYLQFSGRSF